MLTGKNRPYKIINTRKKFQQCASQITLMEYLSIKEGGECSPLIYDATMCKAAMSQPVQLNPICAYGPRNTAIQVV